MPPDEPRLDERVGEPSPPFSGKRLRCRRHHLSLSQDATTRLTEDIARLEGEINEMRHQYQCLDQMVSPLLERDLVGGFVQLQLNLDRVKSEVLQATNALVHDRLATVEAALEKAMEKAIEDGQSRKAQLEANAAKLVDLERRMGKMEGSYAAMSAMYTQICEMHDSMHRIIGVPNDHVKLALKVLEQLQRVSSAGLNLTDVAVVPITPPSPTIKLLVCYHPAGAESSELTQRFLRELANHSPEMKIIPSVSGAIDSIKSQLLEKAPVQELRGFSELALEWVGLGHPNPRAHRVLEDWLNEIGLNKHDIFYCDVANEREGVVGNLTRPGAAAA